MRVTDGLPSLRQRKLLVALHACFAAAKKSDFRVCHFSNARLEVGPVAVYRADHYLVAENEPPGNGLGRYLNTAVAAR